MTLYLLYLLMPYFIYNIPDQNKIQHKVKINNIRQVFEEKKDV